MCKIFYTDMARACREKQRGRPRRLLSVYSSHHSNFLHTWCRSCEAETSLCAKRKLCNQQPPYLGPPLADLPPASLKAPKPLAWALDAAKTPEYRENFALDFLGKLKASAEPSRILIAAYFCLASWAESQSRPSYRPSPVYW